MKTSKLYPELSKKFSNKEILLIHSAMRGKKVDESKLEYLGKRIDYLDMYEILMNAPRVRLDDKKIKQLDKLEKEYKSLEKFMENKRSEINNFHKRVVSNENKLIPIICPFCNQNIIISGGHVAKCELCEFSIGLSTVSDQQDEYIFYNIYNWTNKEPMVVVKKITKEDLYRGRYIRASNLNEVLKDKRIIKIANAWRNGIEIEKKRK